jgi:hypothetical protein
MAQNNTRNRISNLPDSLLCHILSFLPTIEALFTSLLSSRWKTVWTLVPNLYFDVDKIEKILNSLSSDQYQFSFAQILFRVWALRNVNRVQKFRLKCRHFDIDPIDVDSCVRVVIARDVEHIHLNISYYEPLKMPCSLFICKTLVVLKLKGDISIYPPCASSLPSLKTLYLDSVTHSEESLFRFLGGCPVLQNLFIIQQDTLGGGCTIEVKIIVPSLKKLHIWIDDLDYMLEINAPSLEYLYFRGRWGPWVLLENMSNLFEAVVAMDSDDSEARDHGIWTWDFIRALYNVKSLHLYEDTTRVKHIFHCLLLLNTSWTGSNIVVLNSNYYVVVQCLIFSSDLDPPMFYNLVSLSFHYCCKWHALPLVLEQTPNLEMLFFKRISCGFHKERSASGNIRIDEPHAVPKCLSSQLTTFHFEGFGWAKDELEVVRYILKNARILKKLTITSSLPDSDVKLLLLKKLLRFPKCSSKCKIAFVYN